MHELYDTDGKHTQRKENMTLQVNSKKKKCQQNTFMERWIEEGDRENVVGSEEMEAPEGEVEKFLKVTPSTMG